MTHRIPRDQWIDWCDQFDHPGAPHLSLADRDGRLQVVTHIDFAPFDNILEVDIDVEGLVTRRLIDDPTAIWAPDSTREAVVIQYADGALPLITDGIPRGDPNV